MKTAISPAEVTMINKVAARIARPDAPTIGEIKRVSERPYDIHFEITAPFRAGVWLPLGAIRELTTWCSSEIAEMTDYPEMTREGDWSGVRDTDRVKQWEIFNRHVLTK